MRVYFLNKSGSKDYRISIASADDTSTVDGNVESSAGKNIFHFCLGKRPYGWGFDFGINYGAPSK